MKHSNIASRVSGLLGVCLMTLVYSEAGAQLRFTESMFDFGLVPEGKTVSHDFQIENVHSGPVKLQTHGNTCECLKTSLDQQILKPGQRSRLSLSYRATQGLGNFNQAVQVLVEGHATPFLFTIKGKVVEPPVEYTDTLGSVLIENFVVALGEVKTTENKTKTVKIKNIGKKPVKISAVAESSKPYFTGKPSTTTLAAGAEGELIIEFIGAEARKAKLNDGLPLNETVAFTLQEGKDKAQKATFTVGAQYKRTYTKEELDNAPIIQFERTEYNAGEIIQGQNLKYSFVFKNTGKSELEIESAKASCGCTATAPKEKIIPAGGSSQIDMDFDSRGKMGDQHKTITVRTNDPANPTTVLHFRCRIIQDPLSGTGGGMIPVNK
jgi:hypothetical protein